MGFSAESNTDKLELDSTRKPCTDHAKKHGIAVTEQIFFPENGFRTSYAQARAICSGCHVKQQCLAEELRQATNLGVLSGFRAGLTPKQRKQLFREIKKNKQQEDLADRWAAEQEAAQQ